MRKCAKHQINIEHRTGHIHSMKKSLQKIVIIHNNRLVSLKLHKQKRWKRDSLLNVDSYAHTIWHNVQLLNNFDSKLNSLIEIIEFSFFHYVIGSGMNSQCEPTNDSVYPVGISTVYTLNFEWISPSVACCDHAETNGRKNLDFQIEISSSPN